MKLITFDRTKNVNYFGECKLKFHGPDKCLYLKMLDKDPEETMTATFSGIFICKSNLLFCKNHNIALILVFSTKEKCEQIYNGIIKVKSRQPQSSNLFVVNEAQIFKDAFYVPLLQQVQSGIAEHQVLKAIILDFVNSLDMDERIYYLSLLVETLLVPSPFVKAKESVEDTNSFPAVPASSDTVMNSTHASVNNNSMDQSMLQQSDIGYPYSDDEEDEGQATPRKRSRLSCFDEPSPMNSSNDVSFDIVESLHDEAFVQKLLIFTSNERNRCYEFLKNERKCFYRCIKCSDQNKRTIIKVVIHNDGSKTFDFECGEHVCKPINYVPENYQPSLIFKSPDFKFVKRERHGKINPLLIIFDSDDKSMCYRFGFDQRPKCYYCYECREKGRGVKARFIQHDGKNAIELNRLEHICQPREYIPETV